MFICASVPLCCSTSATSVVTISFSCPHFSLRRFTCNSNIRGMVHVKTLFGVSVSKVNAAYGSLSATMQLTYFIRRFNRINQKAENKSYLSGNNSYMLLLSSQCAETMVVYLHAATPKLLATINVHQTHSIHYLPRHAILAVKPHQCLQEHGYDCTHRHACVQQLRNTVPGVTVLKMMSTHCFLFSFTQEEIR